MVRAASLFRQRVPLKLSKPRLRIESPPCRREAVQTGLLELLGEGTVFVDPAPPLSGTLGAALVAAAATGYMRGLSHSSLSYY